MLAMPAAPKHRDMLAAGSGPEPVDGLLSSDFIGGFRERVPPREIAFIQLHAGRQMRAYSYRPDRLGLTGREWARFAVIDWPDHLARMVLWRGIETLQQRFPRIVGRRPGAKMIMDVPREWLA
jgi:hypothetical protein